MSFADFVDVKKLHDTYIGTSQKLLSNTKLADIKVVRVEKSKPGVIMYKTTYSDKDFRECAVAKPNLRRSKSSPELERAFLEKLPLSERKRTDLLSLLQSNAIPSYYSDFYKSVCN